MAVRRSLIFGALCMAPLVLCARRDVVMIAVDDLRPELQSYGCNYMKTPNLDALAADSLVFDHMYTGLALCAPSRTIFLTSRRPDTSRVYTISPAEYWRRSGGNFTSLPQYFKEAGYLTIGTGKIFHPGGPSNDSDSEYSWSSECLPYVNTFPEPDGKTLYDSPAVAPYFNVTDDEMGEGKLANHATSFLQLINKRRSSGDATPFFFAAGFHRPHIPWHAPSKYYDMYDINMPLAPNQHLPVNVPPIALNNIYVGSNIGKGYWNKFTDLGAVNLSENFPLDNTTVPENEQRKIRQAYRAAISFTDRNIGVVLDELKKLGMYDDSIIVFWADHGYQLGDNDQYGKHTNFEHATRIPFMIKLPKADFPDFKPGRTSAFVENVDLFPTLVELGTGATYPRCSADTNTSRETRECTEGISFAPILDQSSAPKWKNASFSQYNRKGEHAPYGVMGYSIRVDGWRYTEWVKFDVNHAGYPGGAKWDQLVGAELYQHDKEGEINQCDWNYENWNLANQPEYAQLRAKLREDLHAGWRRALPQ